MVVVSAQTGVDRIIRETGVHVNLPSDHNHLSNPRPLSFRTHPRVEEREVDTQNSSGGPGVIEVDALFRSYSWGWDRLTTPLILLMVTTFHTIRVDLVSN